MRSVGVLILLQLIAPAAHATTVERSRYLMGTSLTMTLIGPDTTSMEAASTRAFDEVARIEKSLSNWDPRSEVSRLNFAGVRATPVSDDLFAVIHRGMYWASLTGGAFDPAIDPLIRAYDLRGEGRVPAAAEVTRVRDASRWTNVHLDPGARTVSLAAGAGIETGGIGKGYALDRAAAVLRAAGVERALLDFGGQMLAIGAPAGEKGWQVQLADPADRTHAVRTLMLRDASLSTSCQSERGIQVGDTFVGHVIDPRDGRPVRTSGSASVIARTGIDADALSTALLVLGPAEGERFVERYNETAAEPIEAIYLEPGAAPTVALAEAGSAQTAPSPEELARRIDILSEEIETLKQGAAGTSESTAPEARYGLGPAASRVYGNSSGLSIGGYGEGMLAAPSGKTEGGAPSGARNTVDLLRAVTYLGYKFSPTLLFNSELEFEHASTGEGAEQKGEAAIEFAYVDFLLDKRVNLRAGLLLAPIGFVNEQHEPPTYLPATRSDVETFIIPSTWSADGAGLHGDLGKGVSYRAYIMESLRSVASPGVSEGFTAEEGLRGGRQDGSNALAENLGGALRLDWRGNQGLNAGASLFTGGSGQGDTTSAGRTFTGLVTLVEGHAEYRARGLWLRGLYAHGHVDDAAQIDDANGFTGDESVGSSFYGWYAEGGYDLGPHIAPNSSISLDPYVRYERMNTQSAVPEGFASHPANDRHTLDLGAAFFPHPQVSIKAERQFRSTAADDGVSQWNLSLAYLF
jgi:thiamine biosynthesis lipoprotein ApbE